MVSDRRYKEQVLAHTTLGYSLTSILSAFGSHHRANLVSYCFGGHGK